MTKTLKILFERIAQFNFGYKSNFVKLLNNINKLYNLKKKKYIYIYKCKCYTKSFMRKHWAKHIYRASVYSECYSKCYTNHS